MSIKLVEKGEVLHLAKSGRLIVRLKTGDKETKSGELLVDVNGRHIGKVIEVIGPVAAPYASVTPMTDRTNKIISTKVFSGGFLPKRRRNQTEKNHRQTNKRYKT
jgi:RNA-binding protein